MLLVFARRGAHSLRMADDLVALPIDDDPLTVRTRQHAAGFAWELHRTGKAVAVKYSVPIYKSEEAARIAGAEARRLHLGALAKKRKLPNG